MPTEKEILPITIEFGGGAESLFDQKKKHEVNLPGGKWTLKHLLYWIRDNLLKERLELFMQDDTVRPGILVLINDTDWELLHAGLDSISDIFPFNLREPTEHAGISVDVYRIKEITYYNRETPYSSYRPYTVVKMSIDLWGQ